MYTLYNPWGIQQAAANHVWGRSDANQAWIDTYCTDAGLCRPTRAGGGGHFRRMLRRAAAAQEHVRDRARRRGRGLRDPGLSGGSGVRWWLPRASMNPGEAAGGVVVYGLVSRRPVPCPGAGRPTASSGRAVATWSTGRCSAGSSRCRSSVRWPPRSSAELGDRLVKVAERLEVVRVGPGRARRCRRPTRPSRPTASAARRRCAWCGCSGGPGRALAADVLGGQAEELVARRGRDGGRSSGWCP